MSEPDRTRGLTFYVCVGRYAGFTVRFDLGVRVILGWVCFALIFRDVEMFVDAAADALDELDARLAEPGGRPR